MRRAIGVNTWVWASPLDDDGVARLARKAAGMGFEVLELPVENLGDWDPGRARGVLDAEGLTACVVGAMAPGRDLVAATPGAVAETQDYLRGCIDAAVVVGATRVCGPFYAATGRTWRMTADERRAAVVELREHLAPVRDHAAERGVTLGIEPLNRYETSLINTVDQALDALGPLLGEGLGLALDTYHLNIEEKDPVAAVRAAGRWLAHVQVCGTDRGAVGDDHGDWPALLAVLDEVGYAGPLVLESFTSDNASIATAASIWRPLAASQDDLARRSIEFLTRLQETS